MNQIISDVTAVSSKGQIVLPKKIRDRLRISTGTKMIVISDDENIILRPIPTPDINEFKALMDIAASHGEESDMSEGEIDESILAARKHRKLGLARGKYNCPLTLKEFDKDNEDIAGMLLDGDL